MVFAVVPFMGLSLHEAAAQDGIDAKIKRLEDIEARIDAKLQKLEEMEARIETRLQPVSAPAPDVVGAAAGGMPHGMPSARVTGAAATNGKELEARVRHLEEESLHQVIIRGGWTHLNSAAQSAVFTGPKSDKDGWNIGTTIGILLFRDPWFDNSVLGEVALDFTQVEGNTQFALGKSGKQSLFRVNVAPKYRLDTLGALRPWIAPIGISFLVNSPPSDSAAYLTVGGTTGAGVEYVVHRNVSVGVGMNYNFYEKSSNQIDTNHLSITPYVALNY
jgi:hypothetical protein